MGSLTTITIHNDALHAFKKDPEGFAKAIFSGINEANKERKEVSVGFSSYANYIHVQPTRHADDETIYFHRGNGVTNLCGDEMLDLQKRNPELASDYLNSAIKYLKYIKKKFGIK